MMNGDQPTVTCLVLCYNQAGYVERALASVQAQEYKNLDVIIIDDSSSDSSVTVIRQFLEHHNLPWRCISHGTNRGICATLNEGLELARGALVGLLAADDEWLPGWVSVGLGEYLRRRRSIPDLAGVIADAIEVDENGGKVSDSFIRARAGKWPRAAGLFPRLLHGNFLPACAGLVRRDLMLELGGFDENLLYEDWDFWLRVTKAHHMELIDQPMIKYTRHPGSMSDRMKKNIETIVSNAKIMSKHIGIDEEYDALIFDALWADLWALSSNRHRFRRVVAETCYKLTTQRRKKVYALCVMAGLPHEFCSVVSRTLSLSF